MMGHAYLNDWLIDILCHMATKRSTLGFEQRTYLTWDNNKKVNLQKKLL